MKSRNPNSQLFGFLEGPIGIIKGNYVELTADIISFYKNRGKLIYFISKGDSTWLGLEEIKLKNQRNFKVL